jgi:hypothetical protein
MAIQYLLDLLRNLLDWTPAGHRSVKVGEKSAHCPGQAHR